VTSSGGGTGGFNTVDPWTWPYGTRVKESAPDRVFFVQAIARDALGEWAEPLASMIPYVGNLSIETWQLCAQPPVPYELSLERVRDKLRSFGPQNITYLLDYVKERYWAYVWPDYCELNPAPEPEAPPPPPVEILPTPAPPADVDLPPAPPVVANDPALGAYLDAILQAITVVRDQLAWVMSTIPSRRWRPGEPFDIEGRGQQEMAPFIGLLAWINHWPDYLATNDAIPLLVQHAGFVSWGTFGNVEKSESLERVAQMFWTHGAEANTVVWDLRDGVQATLTPLYLIPYTQPGPPPLFNPPAG
jgi:hypothetical protein